MEYVVLPKAQQELLLRSAKERLGLTWVKLADLLGIHRSMIFFYLNGHSRMPIDRYRFLIRYPSCRIPYSETICIDNKQKGPKLPEKLNEYLAEFLGALAGDGHVDKITYEVHLCADKDLDTHYATKHLPFLFKNLFGLNPKHWISQNRITCYAYCKKLVEFLEHRFGVPIGKKMGRLHIPEEIRSKEKFLIAYLRGLFDTDGSIYQHHRTDAAVNFSSGDPVFLREIQNALCSLGFSASTNGKGIFLYSKRDVQRFFSLIRPANKKHLHKYQVYLRTKQVPKTQDMLKGIARFIKGQTGETCDAPVV